MYIKHDNHLSYNTSYMIFFICMIIYLRENNLLKVNHANTRVCKSKNSIE